MGLWGLAENIAEVMLMSKGAHDLLGRYPCDEQEIVTTVLYSSII